MKATLKLKNNKLYYLALVFTPKEIRFYVNTNNFYKKYSC